MSEKDEGPLLSEYKQRKLDAVMKVAPKAIRKRYRPDCCIAATRILHTCLTSLNVQARALSVLVEIVNPAWVKLREETGCLRPDSCVEAAAWGNAGAWAVILGLPEEKAQPNRWPGHLVLLAWESVVLDVSITQACRPAKGINLMPLALGVPQRWVRAEETRVLEMNGSHLEYVARPQDRSFVVAGDWQDHARHAATVEEIMAEVRRILK